MDRRNTLSDGEKIALATVVGVGAGLLYYMFGGNENESPALDVACSSQISRKRKPIEVIDTDNECNRAVEILKQHCRSYNVVGFDCEWVSNCYGRKPVALLQLATHEGYCALFRLCQMPQIPQCLRDFLQQDNLITVGVSSLDDADKLRNDYNINVKKTFDLRFFAVSMEYSSGKLSNLARSILGVEHFSLIGRSDWEAAELSEEQISYAADDALDGVNIYKKLADEYREAGGFLFNPGDISTMPGALTQYINKRFLENFHNDLPSILK